MQSAQTNTETGVKISNKAAGSIGLFGAISVIIGAVIGIGVFFKNGSVFRNNNGNGLGVLFSWLIAFVIALATAYSYVEIVSVKTKSVNAGLGAWSTEFGGNRIGRFVRLGQPIMYYGMMTVVCSLFAAEAILNIPTPWVSSPGEINYVGFWAIALLTIVLVLFFISVNVFTNRIGKIFAKGATITKFIPIATIIVLGITFGALHPNNNIFNHNNSVYSPDPNPPGWDTGNFSFSGMLTSLPAIMFAFDSFLIVGNVSSHVKNPKRNVPLSIVISMITSGTIYIMVTISQIISGCANPYLLFSFIFGNGHVGATVGAAVISIFIMIAILGVVNSVSMAIVNSSQSLIEDNIIVGSKWFNKMNNRRYLAGGYILSLLTAAMWWLIICVPSLIMNSDKIGDAVSNFNEVYIYGIYAFVILLSLINRRRKKVVITPSKLQFPIGIIAIFGCFLAVGYCVFYSYSFEFIQKGYGNNDSNCGLFFMGNWTMKMWEEALVFWSIGLFMMAFPYINDLIIKRTDKSYDLPFVWQKVSKISCQIVAVNNETQS